jgi:MFS family permease
MSVRNELQPKRFGSGRAYLRRVVAASMAGTVVEWYEFFLYGTAATLVFSKVFFAKGGNDLDAILAAFVTYAVGFAARPVGGIVFGQLGDKYGRKKLLQLSLLLVGAATFLMGCLPTFAQIGYWAPALLVALRFIQGFAVGGEWGGAVLLVAEHSPNASRGFWASWPQAGVPGGNMLATAVLLVLTSTLSDAAFLSWGWRVAFWLSAVVVLIGYYIRTKVADAPIFLEAQQQPEHSKATRFGVVEVLKRYPRGVFTAMGLRLGENTMYYLVVTFSITYPQSACAREHQGHLVVAAGRARRALRSHPRVRTSQRPIWQAPNLFHRRGLRLHVGVLRIPDDEQRPQRDHHVGGHHRPGVPRPHVRGPAGHHGGDVPDPNAVFRGVAGLSGHLNRGRVARPDHCRSLARDVQVRGAHRVVSGGHRGGECHCRRGRPRDQGSRPGRHRPRRPPRPRPTPSSGDTPAGGTRTDTCCRRRFLDRNTSLSSEKFAFGQVSTASAARRPAGS